ncbi:MAG: AbrB/MazE/SpoVT family DNA-binding domain-containing protein [Patescibacteria group bacterium]
MIKPGNTQKEFYGATTVGAKGQIVIPAEARKAMGLKEGEKLLVFGMGCDMVAFTKLSNMEKFASHLAGNLKTIRSILKKTERA